MLLDGRLVMDPLSNSLFQQCRVLDGDAEHSGKNTRFVPSNLVIRVQGEASPILTERHQRMSCSAAAHVP
jgi:hypothetical protein